jgi:hypothetical protein
VHCPICSQPVDGGELVMVCAPCHRTLGGIDVGTTGEFRVPTPDTYEAATSGERPNATNVCSWCGKLEVDVKKLLGRGGVALCNECVSLASDILEAELGPGWR